MSAMSAFRETSGAVAAVVPLPRAAPPILGVGAFLKNTLCLVHGREALLSADVGNLETVDSVRAFEGRAKDLLAVAGDLPVALAHDLHPDFYSTRWAEAFAAGMGLEAIPVQHHHAHVAAVMAEHGSEEPTLGLALDGFGLGPDKQSWGGELLQVRPDGFTRLGWLAPLAQPGGDRAAREPWRMAAAALHALGRGHEIASRWPGMHGADIIARMLRQNVNCPPTSSCGRLFDAACGLLNVIPVAKFEGEAPMALERMVRRPRVHAGGWRLEAGVLDLLPLLDALSGLDPEDGAELFHGTLAAAMADWVAEAAEASGIRRVALSGGCFLNSVLVEALTEELSRRDIEPLQAIQLKPGDSAVSLGQAWAVAMARG